MVQVSWPQLDADYYGATVMVTYVVERIPRGGPNFGPKSVNATAAAGGVIFPVQPGYTYRYNVIIVDQGRVVFRRQEVKTAELHGKHPISSSDSHSTYFLEGNITQNHHTVL